jgi:lactoylglutathione lyase
MRTLHFGLRVTDRERSIAFYTAVGYEEVGDHWRSSRDPTTG